LDILFNWESQDFFQSLIINANKNFNLKSSSKAFDHIELNATTRICLEIFQIMVFVIFSIHTLFFSLQKLLLRSISQIAINNISLFPIFIFIWRTNIFTIRVNNQKSVFFVSIWWSFCLSDRCTLEEGMMLRLSIKHMEKNVIPSVHLISLHVLILGNWLYPDRWYIIMQRHLMWSCCYSLTWRYDCFLHWKKDQLVNFIMLRGFPSLKTRKGSMNKGDNFTNILQSEIVLHSFSVLKICGCIIIFLIKANWQKSVCKLLFNWL